MSRIPVVEHYRGVGLHAFQPPERIEGVVRPAIDDVYRLSDVVALAAYAADRQHPPEARLFAAARCEAAWELTAEDRALRPKIDMEQMRVSVVALDSLNWIDRTHYGTILSPFRDSVPREVPLTDADLGRGD